MTTPTATVPGALSEACDFIKTLRAEQIKDMQVIRDQATEIDALKELIARQKELIHALECTMSRMDERDSR